MLIELNNISYQLSSKNLLDNINLNILPGKKIGLLGPNGCGKTTLLKLLAGLIRPTNGELLFNGQAIASFTRSDLASRVGLMMQHAPDSLDLTVEQVVALGRMQRPNRQDLLQTLTDNQLQYIANQSYNQLSGGERQRVMFAQLHYQKPQLMLLDEPANHLDIHHSFQVFNLLRQQTTTCISSFHCFNLAAAHCDDLVLMKQGKILVSGSVEKVLQPYWLKQAYDIDTEILRSSQGVPLISVINPFQLFNTTASS